VQTAMVEPALMTETIAQGGEQADPQPSAPVVEPQPVVESAGEPVLQQQAALPPPAPVAALPPAQPQAQLSGFIIQLASHKTEADAQADYNRLVLQHGAVLGNLKYNIQQTKLNTGAVFYQLHLGSFASRQAAKDMCTSLLATGERDCLVKSR
jgi:septal ring-binding cell division protein DamX